MIYKRGTWGGFMRDSHAVNSSACDLWLRGLVFCSGHVAPINNFPFRLGPRSGGFLRFIFPHRKSWHKLMLTFSPLPSTPVDKANYFPCCCRHRNPFQFRAPEVLLLMTCVEEALPMRFVVTAMSSTRVLGLSSKISQWQTIYRVKKKSVW
jgi:hypothetical protein